MVETSEVKVLPCNLITKQQLQSNFKPVHTYFAETNIWNTATVLYSNIGDSATISYTNIGNRATVLYTYVGYTATVYFTNIWNSVTVS